MEKKHHGPILGVEGILKIVQTDMLSNYEPYDQILGEINWGMPTIRIKCFRDLIQVYFRQIRSTIKAISYKSKLMEKFKEVQTFTCGFYWFKEGYVRTLRCQFGKNWWKKCILNIKIIEDTYNWTTMSENWVWEDTWVPSWSWITLTVCFRPLFVLPSFGYLNYILNK